MTGRLTWADDGLDWVRDGIVYQVFPDRFARGKTSPHWPALEPWDAAPTFTGFKGGDLDGIRERLDYLQDLGVTALYLTPIFQSAANHRYHTADYFAVDPLLGGGPALQRLLRAAHGRGMRVILDGVFNHVGRGHFAFHHVVENGVRSPFCDWFFLDAERLRLGKQLDAYPASEASAGEGDLAAFGYRAWWGLPALPKLNLVSPAARAHVLEAARHWLALGIDGWRLDVPGDVEAPGFWAEFREICKTTRGDSYLVGEEWRDGRRWFEGSGGAFDGVMDYVFGRALLGFLFPAAGALADVKRGGWRDLPAQTGKELGDALVVIREGYGLARLSTCLGVIGSHDTARLVNVAGGDRNGVRLALLAQLTWVAPPMIYYGDEIGMAGGPDPECRRGFEWQHAAEDRETRPFVRTLAARRRASAALRRGDFRVIVADEDVIVYVREAGPEVAVVALNRGEAACSRSVALPALSEVTDQRVELSGARCIPGSEMLGFELEGRSGGVWFFLRDAHAR